MVRISEIDLDEKHDLKSSIRQFPSRTNSTASTNSIPSAGATAHQQVRKARFAEATSVFSPSGGPGEHDSPFADSNMTDRDPSNNAPKPSDVGFGYISDNQPVEQHATIRTDLHPGGAPLKSALKTPGTAARLLNPLSPTFHEEASLEKQEEKTDKEQAKDLVRLGLLNTRSIVGNANLPHRKSRLVSDWRR